MKVTLSGMVTLARLVQPLKAVCPILVTLSGMVISVSVAQPVYGDLPVLKA
jgi:hypothetical protein